MLILKFFEKQFMTVLIISSLLLWATVASIFAISQKREVILLRMDGFDTAIVSEKARTPVEIENFLNHFVGLFYSYTSTNYEDHIDRSMFLMGKKVALEFSPKLNKMFEKVRDTHTYQSSMVTKISRIRDFEYEILMKVLRRENEGEKTEDYRARIKLSKTKRSMNNAFGLKVTSLEEFYD